MAAKPKPVDWISVEAQYRAGVLSLDVLAAQHNISRGAVQKRAKSDGWVRDLTKRIEAAREAKVARSMVAGKVAEQRAATEEQVVQANAEIQKSIILEQREDIQVLKQTVVGLAAELKAVSHGDLQAALEVILDERCDNKSQTYITALNKAFDAALALGGRSSAAKNLVSSLGILIDKERQAFGIDKDGAERKSLAEWLDAA